MNALAPHTSLIFEKATEEEVGYGLILSVEGAEIGVPVAKAGEAISGAGALGEIGIDIINGDLGNLSKEGLFYLANKAIEFGLKKKFTRFQCKF